ncbi:unnamed protein product [Linum trigynum]|uniref:Retrotransposon Copia-like N-terminal domain-containing protein n=1 Tax=Linum trigynum TaxID=586398 RepID=A0AAV2FRQ6_9ROSI
MDVNAQNDEQPTPQPQNQQHRLNQAQQQQHVQHNVYQMEDHFFLTGSEHLSLLLVGEKLTTTNYNDWSRGMYNTLATKNKFGLINGTIPEPDPADPLHGARVRNNIMIQSWIQQAVDSEIRKTILSCKTTTDVWKSLPSIYGFGDIIRVAEL